MVPSTVTSYQATPALIEGHHFRNTVHTKLDDTSAPLVTRGWTFTIPRTTVVNHEAVYVDTETLSVVVPAGLDLGTYDVRVTAPSGEADALDDALTVVAEVGTGGQGGSAGTSGQSGAAGTAGAAGAPALGPFGTPQLITALSDPAALDDDPGLTQDLLELYFASDRAGGPGGCDIWASTRASTSEPWGPPRVVTELSSPEDDALPCPSADGLTIWLGSGRTGGAGGFAIWASTRANRSSPWSTPALYPELNSVAMDIGLHLTVSGLVAVITTTRAGGLGGRDLWWASRASATSAWDTPTPIPGINSAVLDSDGRLVSGERHLYFSSERDGTRDLFVATRPSASDPFSPPQPIAELNTLSADADPWVSEDGHYLVYTSDRSGNNEIYEVWR